MLMNQAVAELAILLSMVTGAEGARDAIARALEDTGLSHAQTLTDDDVALLLSTMAADGGPLEQFARQLATTGLSEDDGAGIAGLTDSTDRSAA
jgi:hypothetical protein